MGNGVEDWTGRPVEAGGGRSPPDEFSPEEGEGGSEGGME